MSWADLGLSVIIVACKSDLVKVDDAVSLKRAKAIQGQLRSIALHIGAGVVFVSAATDTNNSRLKRYIINRLYPESVSDERGIEVRRNHHHSMIYHQQCNNTSSRLSSYPVMHLDPLSLIEEHDRFKRYSNFTQDGVSTAFIPSGADSAELILISTGIAIDSGEGLLATQLDSPLSADDEGGTQCQEHLEYLKKIQTLRL